MTIPSTTTAREAADLLVRDILATSGENHPGARAAITACIDVATAAIESRDTTLRSAVEAEMLEECAGAAAKYACSVPSAPVSACEHIRCMEARAAAARIRALATGEKR